MGIINNRHPKVRCPKRTVETVDMISEVTGLPRTKAFGIFNDSITMPSKIEIKRMPKSKKRKLTLTWKKEMIIK